MLLAAAAVTLLPACSNEPQELVEFGGPTMGTTYTVKVLQGPSALTPASLQAGVNAVLLRANRLLSTYDKDSELSQLNHNQSTDWIGVSVDLLAVIEEAQRVSALSSGAFDITVGPLVNLWGFGPELKADEIPSQEAIDQALARVGYQRLLTQAEPPAIKKGRADIYLDLSALGEGYGADKVAEYLESQGIFNYMVAVAGAIRVGGHNAKGSPWIIAVEEPSPGKRAVHKIIQISDEGLSTSGDYRNFFEKDGKRYSHEIDPKTGRPIQHRLASVTVVSAASMHADAMATALMVMGEAGGFQLAQERKLAAYFIVRVGDGFKELSTPAFQRYLVQ
jgi:thiamine biosynthesis lipoprotein